VALAPGGPEGAPVGAADRSAADRRYADLIRLSPDAILVNRSDRIELANEAAARLFGEPSPERLLGRSPFDWFHPDDHGPVRARIQALLRQGGHAEPRTVTVRRADGTSRRAEATAAAFDDPGGRGIQVVLHDVTERERYERDLTGYARRLADILESVTDAFYAVDPAWRLTYVNRRTEELWQTRREALLGQDLWQHFGSSVHPEAAAQLRRAMQERTPVRFEVFSGYLRTWVETFAYPAAEGGLSVFFRDITDRKQAERRLRLVAEALPQLVWITDGEGRLEFFNGRWRDYTGQLAGAEAWEPALHPDDREEVLSRWAGATAQRVELEQEHRLRRYDGTYRWFLRRAFPLQGEAGQVVQWFGTCTDVDDLKRSHEVLQQSAHFKEDFLRMAAHEFRTPLTALRLQLDLMHRTLQRPAPEAARLARQLAVAQAQSDRLTALVGTLLDVTRMDAGRFELDLADFDLGLLVREVVERFRPEAEAARTELRCRAAALTGRWDRARLDQVITNLVSNAIKYGDQRPVEVELAPAEGAVRLRVRDGGVGIAPEEQARLFERFERGGAADQYGGLGLGLWIVRLLVEAHGGRVTVESAPGQGALFTVTLPEPAPGAPGQGAPPAAR